MEILKITKILKTKEKYSKNELKKIRRKISEVGNKKFFCQIQLGNDIILYLKNYIIFLILEVIILLEIIIHY